MIKLHVCIVLRYTVVLFAVKLYIYNFANLPSFFVKSKNFHTFVLDCEIRNLYDGI